MGALTVSHKSNDGTFHCAIKTSSGKLAMKVVSLPDDKSATGYLQGVHAFTDPITDLRCHGIQNTCARQRLACAQKALCPPHCIQRLDSSLCIQGLSAFVSHLKSLPPCSL